MDELPENPLAAETAPEDTGARQVSIILVPWWPVRVMAYFFPRKMNSSNLLVGRSTRPDQPIYCAMAQEFRPGDKKATAYWAITMTIGKARATAYDLNSAADQMEMVQQGKY